MNKNNKLGILISCATCYWTRRIAGSIMAY